MDYLTSEQLARLATYRHSAPKTSYETFYVERLLVPVEKYLFPRRWSANTITLVGQVPLFGYMLYLWGTQNVTMRDPIPNANYIAIAAVIQWFSLLDCMDGMRARRTKCGSPLGRIIDEAIDQLAYGCIGCFIGYLLRVEPGFWVFAIGLVNLPFYAMEIRHCFARDFIMIIGEIGPVEIELIYSLLFLVTGCYLGGDCFDRPLSELTGVAALANFKLKNLVQLLTIALLVMFTFDNVGEALKRNRSETLLKLFPAAVFICLAMVSGQLPSFQEETAVVYFMYQMAFATVILKLMLFNMSGRPFGLIHYQYLYPLIPVVAFALYGARAEIIATRLCLFGALFEFLFTIARISRQYVRHFGISFFLLKQVKDD